MDRRLAAKWLPWPRSSEPPRGSTGSSLDRRTFVSAAGASMTASALGIPGLALASCAPKRFPWPGTTRLQALEGGGHADWFELDGKRYSLWVEQYYEGERFETWKTPNGWVSIAYGSYHKRDKDMVALKQQAIAWHDENTLGKNSAS